MRKAKYYIIADNYSFESNSRNARKHLIKNNASYVEVCINNDRLTAVSYAIKHWGVILVGTAKR